MLWKWFIVSIVLGCVSLGSQQSRKETGELTLEEQIEQLTDLSARRPVIRLNGQKFKNLVGKGSLPRNYSVVVMMTALSSNRQCQICRQASDEFSIVATSWRHSSDFSNTLFFAMVDYDEGSEVFNQLSINSAPVFIYFGENGKIKTADQMDIQRIGFQADTIGRWVQEKSGITIRINRPPNYAGLLLFALLGLMVLSLLYLKRNDLDFLYNRTSWAMAAMLLVFTMTSGQMWNHIRGPPLMQRTQKGINYIHGSSSGQFVAETYFIFLLNGLITVGVILINESMRGRGDPKKKKIMACIGLALTAVFFSILLSIFRSKAHGYPYSFLFK